MYTMQMPYRQINEHPEQKVLFLNDDLNWESYNSHAMEDHAQFFGGFVHILNTLCSRLELV